MIYKKMAASGGGGGVLSFYEDEGHQGQGEDGHRGADGQVDAEVDVLDHQVGHQQQADAHRGGDQVMVPDVRLPADQAAQVGNAQGDETDRAADAHGAGHQAHDREQQQRLPQGGDLRLSPEMPGQQAGLAESRRHPDAEEHERENDVPCRHALQAEVGRTPEVILFQQVPGRGIGHHDGAQGADEGPEQDAEGERIVAELKAWRKRKAEDMNMPPYIIFNDKTLYDIAAKKPKSKADLRNVYGIGEAKIEQFGTTILRIVAGE